jgi:hypothetical protein
VCLLLDVFSSMKRQYKSTEAFDDPIMDPDKGIYGKLAKEQVRANRKSTDPGEYEATQSKRREYKVSACSWLCGCCASGYLQRCSFLWGL